MDVQTSTALPSRFLSSISLTNRTGLWLVLLVALLTHLPFSPSGFSTDDYLIREMTTGDIDKPVFQSLMDGFHFYSPRAGTLQEYREYGNLPWWTADNATMNPWRPLSALTHWLDNQLVPGTYQLQLLHSMLYVLLFAWCGYRLFARISDVPSVAVLASLMLVVDFSHTLNFSWIAARNVFIAGALGCAMLERFVVWRQQQRMDAFWSALGLFVAGLLAAESAIAILGYAFAYLFWIERGPLLRRLLPLAPFLLVLLAWRMLYSALGYGAADIGLYIDPGRSFGEFVLSALGTIPVLLGSVLTTLDSATVALAPEARVWMELGSAVVAFSGLLLVVPLLLRSGRARFLLTGSLLAAVPGAALVSAGPRSGMFISVGFFWLLASWLHYLARSAHWRRNRVIIGGALCLHLFVPGMAAFLGTSGLIPVVQQDDEQFESIAKPLTRALGRRSLVIVNTNAPNRMFYLPFEWRYKHGVIPQSMNVLAPGLNTFDLKRVSTSRFELTSVAGLPLDQTRQLEDLNGHHPWMSSAYSSLMLQGLFASPDTDMSPGTVHTTADMKVTIMTLKEGLPTRLRIDFEAAQSPDAMLWQYFDWRSREYKAMPALLIGETRRFAGPFDTEADNFVKLCINCES